MPGPRGLEKLYVDIISQNVRGFAATIILRNERGMIRLSAHTYYVLRSPDEPDKVSGHRRQHLNVVQSLVSAHLRVERTLCIEIGLRVLLRCCFRSWS
jgi:hypothetical protein